MVYGAIEAAIDRVQGSNLWLTVGLREGKNREVKRVLEHLGLCVNRLIRISYGPFQLGDLKPGAVEEVRGRVLRDQLGEKLAKAAGADFVAADPLAGAEDRESTRRRHKRVKDRMRVVGGRLRGRALAAPRHECHPPDERQAARVALQHPRAFPWPAAAETTRVLDLFAGTGALGHRSALARRSAMRSSSRPASKDAA